MCLLFPKVVTASWLRPRSSLKFDNKISNWSIFFINPWLMVITLLWDTSIFPFSSMILYSMLSTLC